VTTIVQVVSLLLPTVAARVQSPDHVGLVVEKVALG
jgi:hypothetical protein